MAACLAHRELKVCWSRPLPPLLSTSCPQGKPPTDPTVNFDPSPEISTSCSGARHVHHSRGRASTPRHTKTRSKKNKRAALQMANPSFDVPCPPPLRTLAPAPKPGATKRGLAWPHPPHHRLCGVRQRETLQNEWRAAVKRIAKTSTYGQ
ncbi:hypothetical protein F7725_024818 [Dissostichus mawsoni]|uniref:Uncharacterized protein n=1 Tax=Dissostichus mawsoni TaxID=36200 RepID=A0A7J5X9D2_DISMA|nr:hypothetical protein F7725_024818 [Dissostichus mawsoni]